MTRVAWDRRRSSSHSAVGFCSFVCVFRDDLFRPRNQRSSEYLGKLRSNGSVLDFVLYDVGNNPSNFSIMGENDSEDESDLKQVIAPESVRKELCYITYTKSTKKVKKRRFMRGREYAVHAVHRLIDERRSECMKDSRRPWNE